MRGLKSVGLAALLLLAGCGSPPAGSLPSPDPTPTPTPQPPLVQGVLAECPQNIANSSGKYSFSCPVGWKVIDCAQTEFNSPYTWLINPAEQRRQEMAGVRALAISVEGDQPPPAYLGELRSSQSVTVDAVSGTVRAARDDALP